MELMPFTEGAEGSKFAPSLEEVLPKPIQSRHSIDDNGSPSHLRPFCSPEQPWSNLSQHDTSTSTMTPRFAASRSNSRPVSRVSVQYTRTYSLTEENAPPPPKRLSVYRERSGSRQPRWNSNADRHPLVPKEKLPCIDMHVKDKYDLLHLGRSAVETDIKPASHRYVYDHTTDCRQPPEVANAEKRRKIEAALRALKFPAILERFDAKDVEAPEVKEAIALFEILSKQTRIIAPEMLHETLLLFTTPGVALHEAYDFLKEECEAKKALTFQSFLRFGDRFRDRLFAFQEFSRQSDREKMMSIMARVLPDEEPSDKNEALLRLLAVSEEQEKGRVGEHPLRVYERLFLVQVEKKMMEVATRRSSNGHRMSLGSSSFLPPPFPLAPSSPKRKLKSCIQDSTSLPCPKKNTVEERVSWGENNNSTSSQNNKSTNKKEPGSEYPSLARCPSKGDTVKRASGTKKTGLGRLQIVESARRRQYSNDKKRKSQQTGWDVFILEQTPVVDLKVYENRFNEADEERRRKDDDFIRDLGNKYKKVHSNPMLRL